MRKVTFYIDDIAYMAKLYGLTQQQAEEMFREGTKFVAIYTLYGDKQPDRFDLTDRDGNKMNINALNGFQRGIVLNDCMAYFNGGKYSFDGKEPFGVISIVEETVDE